MSSQSLERGRFTYLPVVPGRLEFAIEVRRRILAERPEVVAIELPDTLESLYLDAIQRLPQISVVFYNDVISRDKAYRSEDETEQAVYVPVEPADPFVEAIRTAQEIGAQIVFADPDSLRTSAPPDTYPGFLRSDVHSARASMWRRIASIRRSARRSWNASPEGLRGNCRARIRWRAFLWFCR